VTVDLEHVTDLTVALAPPHEMGRSAAGTQRIIPIVGGRAEGPLIGGEILNVGADWQTVTSDGVAELDARYAIATHDGAVIEVISRGLRHASLEVNARIKAGEAVNPAEYYMRTHIRLATGHADYDWVNRSLFVATGGKVGNEVRLAVYRVA
jgi:hypothetical protein